ncbi:MAG TPA: SMC-Scp complex subunit ScpB [Desulfobacteraceae bacterium]|nr:SMC-Scp complex subunit ScpB [Desulfobacteraceae bacterium]
MTLAKILEAIMFAADKPVSIPEFCRILPDYDRGEIQHALDRLKSDYQTMNRSFILKEVAGGYEFRTKAEYADYVISMLRTSPSRLSRAAMETLAIIAYKQPIIRQEIEVLRGVDVGGVLRTLLEKNLIKVVGRKNIPGKPLIYGTTSRFLEVFDLQDIKSLPELKEIKELESDEDWKEPFNTEFNQERREKTTASHETEATRKIPGEEAGDEKVHGAPENVDPGENHSPSGS